MNSEQKEEINHIILRLKDSNYLCKKIIRINNELEEISTMLVGVSSPCIREYIIENKKPYSHSNKLNLMMREEELIGERDNLVKSILEYESLVESLDPDVKKLVIELYILKKRHSEVAKKCFCDRKTIYRKINSNLIKVATL